MKKAFIVFDFNEGPWGGGNQFLKSLRKYFEERKLYAENIEEADMIFFNSHHNLKQVLELRKKFRNEPKVFIHRVDGPVSLYKGENSLFIDETIFRFNDLFSDGTVFQSNWSRGKCHELGMTEKDYVTIINAPDEDIFNKSKKKSRNFSESRVNLIATSWSDNWNKGFRVYKWLDDNLDFGRFKMTFVGNSPVNFKKIEHIKPLTSGQLAEKLKAADIFITASLNDPCSNSLIEAMHCGRPAVGCNSGGHPEIIGEGGEVFDSQEEIPLLLEKIAGDYENYQSRIKLPSFEEVGDAYYNFASEVFDKNLKARRRFDFWRGDFLLWKNRIEKVYNKFFHRR